MLIFLQDFDGLKIVLRFEVDSCLLDQTSKAKDNSAATTTKVDDDLSSLLSGLTVTSTSSSPATVLDASGLRIQRGGRQVPHEAILELTTRSERNADQFDWGNAYPQLFFSQTPNHYLAVHNSGTFTRIIKHTLDSTELKKIDKNAQGNFKRLRRALQDIQDVVKQHGQRGRLTLVHQNGTVKVYERTDTKSCLPDDIMKRFEN